MGSNRWAHLMFVFGGLLACFLMVKATEWVWGYFGKPKAIYADAIGIAIGVIITLIAWRRKSTFTKATEITMELKKVTWPTRKETSAATVVVIVTVIISAMILGLFDLIWSWASGKLYS
jgi:preprotein translocase subunit SecE